MSLNWVMFSRSRRRRRMMLSRRSRRRRIRRMIFKWFLTNLVLTCVRAGFPNTILTTSSTDDEEDDDNEKLVGSRLPGRR